RRGHPARWPARGDHGDRRAPLLPVPAGTSRGGRGRGHPYPEAVPPHEHRLRAGPPDRAPADVGGGAAPPPPFPPRPGPRPPRRYGPPARAVADTARWLTDLSQVRALVGDAVQQGRCAVGQLDIELRVGGARNGALLRRVIAEVADGVRSAPEAELRDLIVKA